MSGRRNGAAVLSVLNDRHPRLTRGLALALFLAGLALCTRIV